MWAEKAQTKGLGRHFHVFGVIRDLVRTKNARLITKLAFSRLLSRLDARNKAICDPKCVKLQPHYKPAMMELPRNHKFGS